MKISDCCGVPAYSNGDSSTEDYGICPDCKEHCEYVEEDDGEPNNSDIIGEFINTPNPSQTTPAKGD